MQFQETYKFIDLCNHYHSQNKIISITVQVSLVPFGSQSPHYTSAVVGNYLSAFSNYCFVLPLPRISRKWNHTICTLLYSASFAHHVVFESPMLGISVVYPIILLGDYPLYSYSMIYLFIC